LRNSDLIDLAFAAEEHWRTELIDDDRASIESFASVEQTVPIEAGAMSLHVGWGNAPPARRMTLRFRRDDVPAYVADDNAPLRVDYFFRGLPSASES
jgi:hypothetical protein